MTPNIGAVSSRDIESGLTNDSLMGAPSCIGGVVQGLAGALSGAASGALSGCVIKLGQLTASQFDSGMESFNLRDLALAGAVIGAISGAAVGALKGLTGMA